MRAPAFVLGMLRGHGRPASLAAVCALALALAVPACGDDPAAPRDAEPDGIIRGCPSLRDPVAAPGDPADGDTWATYAQGFFATWCTRCHSSTLPDGMRTGAPVGLDWNVEASVRANLPRIRNAVGVLNFMPLTPPDPSCDDRHRIVRWIDVGAP